VGQAQGLAVVAHQVLAAGDHRDARFLGELARLVLVPQAPHGLLGRADELDVARAADLGEVGVLREEAVAGVDGLDVADLGGADEAGDVQVAFRGGGGADADGFVRQAQVGRVAVRFAEDSHDFDAQVAAGPDDAQGDFAAVGNKDPLEHSHQPSAVGVTDGRFRLNVAGGRQPVSRWGPP
jgi:hypothetical protein